MIKGRLSVHIQLLVIVLEKKKMFTVCQHIEKLPVCSKMYSLTSICSYSMLGVVMFHANFQQYFSYIVVVIFIGGGNCSTWRKPVTCAFKSPAKFITTSVVMGTDGTGSCKSNYLTITMTPPILNRKTIIKIVSQLTQ